MYALLSKLHYIVRSWKADIWFICIFLGPNVNYIDGSKERLTRCFLVGKFFRNVAWHWPTWCVRGFCNLFEFWSRCCYCCAVSAAAFISRQEHVAQAAEKYKYRIAAECSSAIPLCGYCRMMKRRTSCTVSQIIPRPPRQLEHAFFFL